MKPNRSDIRDKFIGDINALADHITVDKDTKLSKHEIEILKTLPSTLFKKIEKVLGNYKSTSKYDVRRELVLKAVAQMAINAKELYNAYSLGKESGSELRNISE